MLFRSLIICLLLLASPALAQSNNFQPPPPGQLGLIATGNNQSSALPLPAALNVFSSVPVGAGARVPSIPTAITVVNNDPANALLLYPPANDQIIGFNVNQAVSVAAGQQATLTWFGSALTPKPGQWVLSNPSSGAMIPSGSNATSAALDAIATAAGQVGGLKPTDAPSFASLGLGGLSFSGSAPVVSLCGTNPAIDTKATNNSGTVTVGTVSATSCTMTFANGGFTTWNHCRVTSQTTEAAFAYSYTKTVLTVTGTSLVGDLFDYDCDGV